MDRALIAFAASGYEAMSLRLLNRDLGLSHGTISQRFGSKEQLYSAALDHGFGGLVGEITVELARRRVAPANDLDVVRETIRAFLVGSARRPHLVRLMNQEGLQQSPRLDYIFDTIIGPTFSELLDPLERLAKAGKIRPVPARAIFFLLTHGAAAPYTLRALSEHFDGYDGPLDDVAHADLMTELLLAALRT
jgi:AcrR family transcriptional regulator